MVKRTFCSVLYFSLIYKFTECCSIQKHNQIIIKVINKINKIELN